VVIVVQDSFQTNIAECQWGNQPHILKCKEIVTSTLYKYKCYSAQVLVCFRHASCFGHASFVFRMSLSCLQNISLAVFPFELVCC